MRAPNEAEDFLTREIIGKAIAIHRVLGPGLLESVYEYFLAHELRKAGMGVQQQKPVAIEYDGEIVDLGFRPDLICQRGSDSRGQDRSAACPRS